MNCGQCGQEALVCTNCHSCSKHCYCPVGARTFSSFDADELGLDPETDNTPEDPSRHA